MQEIIIDEKKKNKLTPISLSILDSILTKKVTIIFSQGPLNLSPIISCIFAFKEQGDVLIGIPKRRFNDIFTKNTRIFFSLVYRKKYNSIPSNHFNFYNEMIWGKGLINEELNELSKIDIEKRPKHGTRDYMNDYEYIVNKKLSNGDFQNVPKIVSVPIVNLTPSAIMGEKTIEFEKQKYILNNFYPKLMIYESINERKYSLQNLLKLIFKSEESDVKLVLHFSWPYLKGLSTFLATIKNNKNINILHLGKRICIENRNKFQELPSHIIPLSLEGDLWDLYYPTKLHINFKIILPSSGINGNIVSIDDIENWDWPFDERIKDIRDYLKYKNVNKLDATLLKFPPIFDTVLSPFEIKRRVEKKGIWMSLPIEDSFSVKTNENSYIVSLFKGLCSDIEKSRDISYELRDLYTTTIVLKKTLFQAFLIGKLNQACGFKSTSKSEIIPNVSIVIANLHPYLATQSSLSNSVEYLVNSIKNILNENLFPILASQGNTIWMETVLSNKENLKEIIFKDGVLQNLNIRTIKNMFSEFHSKIEMYVTKGDASLRITAKIKEPVDYLEFNYLSSTINKKHFNELILYDATFRNDGKFNEYKFSKISFARKPNNLIIELKVKSRTEKNHTECIDSKIQIIYGELSKMQTLTQEFIQKSELLIPGPIPFHTISEEDILISHGYDALILPFKEIIFFAYPGLNFKQLSRQIKLYCDLISENHTNIAKRDLLFSIEHTNKSHRFKLPSKPDLYDISEKKLEMDTPIDTAIRQEFLDDSKIKDDDLEEIKTLKDIWNIIQKNTPHIPIYSPIHHPSKELRNFYVEYEIGTRDTISFSIDTLIRKKEGNNYILFPVDELLEGDQIFYIQSEERESTENYLLRTILSEEELSLEGILEPLVALKNFYETLKTIDFKRGYDKTYMDKIGWLLPDQKKTIFQLLNSLLNKDSLISYEFLNSIVLNSIWKGIKPEKIVEIFEEGTKRVTQLKLFNLATELGLTYKENSFKALCSTAIHEHKHYSFHDEDNLLALGQLMGHQEIIDNYQMINKKGAEIGIFLRQVGHSIKRVTTGNSEPFNDMDIAIEGKINKCKIIKIGKY